MRSCPPLAQKEHRSAAMGEGEFPQLFQDRDRSCEGAPHFSELDLDTYFLLCSPETSGSGNKGIDRLKNKTGRLPEKEGLPWANIFSQKMKMNNFFIYRSSGRFGFMLK